MGLLFWFLSSCCCVRLIWLNVKGYSFWYVFIVIFFCTKMTVSEKWTLFLLSVDWIERGFWSFGIWCCFSGLFPTFLWNMLLLTWQSSVTIKIHSYSAVRTSKLAGYQEISCAFDSLDRAAVMYCYRCTNKLQQESVNILPIWSQK
jgi:hypothetical protein